MNSMKEVFDSITKMKDQITWGTDRDHVVAVNRHGEEVYYFPVEQITTVNGLAKWIIHLSEKTWVTKDQIMQVAAIADDLVSAKLRRK